MRGLVSPLDRGGHLRSHGLLAHIHIYQSPPEQIILYTYKYKYLLPSNKYSKNRFCSENAHTYFDSIGITVRAHFKSTHTYKHIHTVRTLTLPTKRSFLRMVTVSLPCQRKINSSACRAGERRREERKRWRIRLHYPMGACSTYGYLCVSVDLTFLSPASPVALFSSSMKDPTATS